MYCVAISVLWVEDCGFWVAGCQRVALRYGDSGTFVPGRSIHIITGKYYGGREYFSDSATDSRQWLLQVRSVASPGS